MKLFGLVKLDEFKRKHASSRGPLDVWRVDVEQARWSGPQDIKQRYPSVSFLADNRVIFNIKGNDFRLVVKVQFRHGIALIEWVGTHAEYDRKRF